MKKLLLIGLFSLVLVASMPSFSLADRTSPYNPYYYNPNATSGPTTNLHRKALHMYQSSSDQADELVQENLPRLFIWLLGIIFAFGVLGIVLVHARRGLKTVRGS